jgi:hypothetical protein
VIDRLAALIHATPEACAARVGDTGGARVPGTREAELPACARSAAARPRRGGRGGRARGGRPPRLALLLVAATVCFGCGKKGPPLAPLLKVPVAPPDVAVRRSGDLAALQLRIPAVNTDNTRPANIERVDVYGFTGAAPTPAEVLKYGTLVASIPVRRPEDEEGGAQRDGASAGSRKPRPPPSMADGFDQGDLVTVTEALGAAQATPVDVKRRGKQPPPPVGEVWQPLLQPVTKAGSMRLYYTIGVNRKGQRGPFAPAQPVPLGPAPSAPRAPAVTYDAKGIELTWTPPPDAPKPIQAAPAEGDLASTPRGERGTTGGYNVYEVPPRKPAAAAAAPVETGAVLKPLNDKLLDTPSFADPHIAFGKERCFAVRTVLQSGGQVTESEPSETVCVTPADTFPPEAPKGLAAVASEGAISLIWEASPDADLAGYIVMRAEGGGAPKAVTPEPIKETTFRDATASRGVRYVYTVVAVDTAGNRSAPSNAVEETAR